MRKPPFDSISAIVAGALAAWLIHWAVPGGEAEIVNQAHRKIEAGYHAIAAFGSAPDPSPEPRSFELVQKRKPAIENRIGVVLLSEPVLILRGSQFIGVNLPRGTRLDVLEDNGTYLRVRYADSVVSVPRSITIRSETNSFIAVGKS